MVWLAVRRRTHKVDGGVSGKALRRWSGLLLLVTASVTAHQGGTTGYAAIDLNGNTLRYQLTLSQWPGAFVAAFGGNLEAARTQLPGALASTLQFSNADQPCAVAGARVAPATAGKEGVVAVLDVVCREPITILVVKDESFDRLGADVHTLARINWPGGTSQFAFATETREARITVAPAAAAPRSQTLQGFGSFLDLGLWHILGGYDHLMFLLALLLAPASGWAIVRVITAFTLAHSVTLALTALDVLHLPPLFIESAIAASIAWVAGENLWRKNAVSHRVLVTAAFGLIHGCGFAGILREVGLPRDHLVGALFGFNLGVELGQLLVVVPLVPLLRWVWRKPWGTRVSHWVSGLLCASGMGLVLLRVLGFG